MSIGAAVGSKYPAIALSAQLVVSRALFLENGNVTKAAARLEVDPRTLFRVLASHPEIRGNEPLAPGAIPVWRKKEQAHKTVQAAVLMGVLLRQGCEICGGVNAVAHHDDYNYPLIVRWLCPAHHGQWHAENGPGANGVD